MFAKDHRLTFNTHMEELRAKVKRRMGAVSVTWGGKTTTIKTFYIAHVRSVLTYGAPAWYPLLSTRKQERLERAQNTAARLITGCWARASPRDVLLELIEHARHRSTLEPLSEMALSMQPAVKDRVVCAETWQQRADTIQAQCDAEAPRKQLIDGVLVHNGRGAMGESSTKENKTILSAQPEASRVIITVR